MQKKLTVKNLEKAGYKRFKSNFNLSECGYQKRVCDGNATLYFINVYFYPRKGEETDGYMPEVQFHISGAKMRWADVTLGGFETIDEVEKFYARFYENMLCLAAESGDGENL